MALFGKKLEESGNIESDHEEGYIVPAIPFYEEEEDGPEDLVDNMDSRDWSSAEKSLGNERQTGWGEWIALAAITVVLSWLVQCSVFQAFNVPSRSMEPNLLVGDSVVVNKMAYDFYLPEGRTPVIAYSGPSRGDVVAFILGQGSKVPRTFSFGEYLLKRVVAIPGDVVEVRNGVTYVNGVAQIDRHSYGLLPAINREPERLAANQYFLLGDNPEVSEDCRFFGPIPRSAIIGKAFVVYWSRENIDYQYKPRFGRIGKLL